MGELFHPETFHGINQQGRQQQQDQSLPLNQIHMSDLALSRGEELFCNLSLCQTLHVNFRNELVPTPLCFCQLSPTNF